MAEIKELFQITSLPGVRRDGTNLDADFYTDGQWLRFQRGKPKKMGGFRRITDRLTGPIRQTLVWSRGLMNSVYSFSKSKIQMTLVDGSGVGGSLYDRTPSGFTSNDQHVWSVDTMYDDAVGSQGTIVVAVATNSLLNIDDDTAKQVYFGLANDTAAFTAISGLSVSGGVVCVGPYLVYYGSDGLVGWSDINQPQTLNSGDAGSDRVTGAKIVKGMPVRGANGYGALLWSLDSLISMQYVGGSAIFRFTTVTAQSSILSQNSVVEYDGSFFWVGVDRFLVYSGGHVQELPNDNNLNWFFDNLNFDQRQKVWAMKVPRYGEIHWYFPFGDAEECTHCVIYNVREKTWYDNRNPRSSGFYSQVFHYPVMSDSNPEAGKLTITLGTPTGTFEAGDFIQAGTSKTVLEILQDTGSNTYTVRWVNSESGTLGAGEAIANLSQTGAATLTGYSELYSMYVHEQGLNAVIGDTETAIESYFETSDFGFPTGGAQQNQIKGLNRWTRLIRIEPDFKQAGDMTVQVVGREFAQQPDTYSQEFTFSPESTFIDMREQRRQIRLRFSSNTLNGNYEMGRVILHTEPGDVRS